MHAQVHVLPKWTAVGQRGTRPSGSALLAAYLQEDTGPVTAVEVAAIAFSGWYVFAGHLMHELGSAWYSKEFMLLRAVGVAQPVRVVPSTVAASVQVPKMPKVLRETMPLSPWKVPSGHGVHDVAPASETKPVDGEI